MEDKYAAMRADLGAKTMKQLREIARAEGICLGYNRESVETVAAAITTSRMYRKQREHKRETWRTVDSHRNCPEVCARAWWTEDKAFAHVGLGGQWNCPYRYGVTYASAMVDGQRNCEHLKLKEVD